jgi:parallel beta-helix repeat protein
VAEYFPYNECLKVLWRDGTENDPYIPIEDVQKIVNNTIVLSEIPDEFNHVQIENYSEIYKGEPESDEFIVNYANGIVTFNSSEEGKTVVVRYFGRGQILISANRVYLHSKNPDIVKTLQDLITNGEEAIYAVGGLQGKIDEADTLKTDLGTLVTDGTILNTNLQNNISDANEINNTLNNTTIPDASSIKGELEGVIDNAGTAKTNLDGSITTGNTLKGDLNGLINDGGTLKTDLGTLVTNGTTLESDLSGKISEGNNLIPDLNEVVTTANTVNGQLNGTIESANTSIDELNAYAFIEEYNPNTDYVPLNKAVYNGSTYQNKVACKGILPTNTDYWILISAKGIDGSGTLVEVSSINGNIKINGNETIVYAHPGSGTNPHGTTKEDIGLGNVDNIKQATKTEFDEHKNDGASHSKTARFVVGTSIAGWTLQDCDYLCDGTNDQEEIIQALNDLPATGGEVVILDGTYNITASINIPKDNVSIRGSGNATTLKRMYNSTNTNSGATAKGLITLNGKSGCKIQGLQIDGNKATYTASYNYGIYLSSSSDNTVTGNTCNSNSYGIYLSSSSSDNTVTGNTCNNSNNGIYLSSSSNNTVTGNTCNSNSYGIYLSSSSSDNTVTGNTCNSNSYCIRLYSSSNNTVTGNTCNNSSYGIHLYSSSNNTVTGNTCNNNSNNGISLSSSSSDNTVTDNTCNNSNNGIYLSSSSNNTVTGNTCIRGTGTPEDYTTDQHTILLSGTGNNYNLISSNNCMGKAPVVEGGTGNTVFNNKWDASDDIQNIEEQINTLNEEVIEHKNDYVKQMAFAVASGTNTYTVTIDGITELVEGLSVKVKFTNANTGASTLNINSLGAKAIKKGNGNDLVAGNIKAGQICHLVYTGVNFQLLGEGGEYGTAQAQHVLAGYTIGTDDGLVSGTIPSKSAQTYTPGTSNQTITSGQYLTGNQTILGSSNLKAENIKSGVSLFGVTGSLKPAIGYNWITQTPPLAGKDIICLYSGNGIQMCVMYEDTVNYKPLLYTRTSTTNWVQRTIPFTKYRVNSIAYGQGLYVMTGSIPYKHVATSSDGISWTLRSVPFYYDDDYTNVLFYEDGLFIVSSDAIDGGYATSTNGTSWTRRTLSGGTIYSIVKGNGLWVMGFDENIYTSTNGTSWVKRGKPFSQSAFVLSLGYGKGLFIAGGNNGAISTSTDGINWTQRTDLSGNVKALVYNSGLYLAGTDTRLYSSEDGINWVQRFSQGYKCIAWGDLLLIGGNNGRFAYSSL